MPYGNNHPVVIVLNLHKKTHLNLTREFYLREDQKILKLQVGDTGMMAVHWIFLNSQIQFQNEMV